MEDDPELWVFLAQLPEEITLGPIFTSAFMHYWC